uniref:Uncharacterized protein n=1 Tax=Physcomitrium patens TaxID=3218 RepID=A0A2K1IE05_PHYPA|nr:hypothetical protein PHYPA_029649 [Physcomitrium patens]
MPRREARRFAKVNGDNDENTQLCRTTSTKQSEHIYHRCGSTPCNYSTKSGSRKIRGCQIATLLKPRLQTCRSPPSPATSVYSTCHRLHLESVQPSGQTTRPSQDDGLLSATGTSQRPGCCHSSNAPHRFRLRVVQGTKDCEQNHRNGCETNVMHDVKNRGDCGKEVRKRPLRRPQMRQGRAQLRRVR